MFKIKSIYESPGKKDGYRILVDKSWPEELSKEDTKVDLWLKEIAPTKNIEEWIIEDAVNFDDFKREYQKELRSRKTIIMIIKKIAKENGRVTLLYSSHNLECNCAVVLRDKLNGYKTIGRSVGRLHGG
ncbi:DUF488 domain-containing protein [Methanobacterium sp.]|uniref:DUF488 domain-containing protein n=1 Tax=Methanobacterium sp. TaxID=2164 RepID=UPI003C744AD9